MKIVVNYDCAGAENRSLANFNRSRRAHDRPTQPGAVTDHQKLFADGREGWLAHVDGDALLVKTFAVVPRDAHAPGEAQIEIYATPAHSYVEVEAQGPYETIAPGAALSWRVVWLVRRLPADVPRTVGSAPLLDFIRGVVETDRALARS